LSPQSIFSTAAVVAAVGWVVAVLALRPERYVVPGEVGQPA